MSAVRRGYLLLVHHPFFEGKAAGDEVGNGQVRSYDSLRTKDGNMNEKPDNGLYMARMKGENVQKSSLVKED